MTYQTDAKPKEPSRRYQLHVAKTKRKPSTPERKALLREVRQAMGEKLYFIEDVESGYIKIGYATDPQGRLYRLQVGNPGELRLLATVKHSEAAEVEQHLHAVFHKHRGRGEWFAPSAELLCVIRTIRREAERGEMGTAVAHIMRERGISWAVKAMGLTMKDWQAPDPFSEGPTHPGKLREE